jgi:hypothetical protein
LHRYSKAGNHWFGLFVQLRKIKTALGRIMNRTIAGAFDRWMEFTEVGAVQVIQATHSLKAPGVIP